MEPVKGRKNTHGSDEQSMGILKRIIQFAGDILKTAGDVAATTINASIQTIQRCDEVNTQFVSYGWPPVPYWELYKMDLRLFSSNDELSEEAVDELFTECYSDEKLNSVLTKWESMFAENPRLNIWRAAINAHIREEYELSVPAILPQIEGFVAERFNHIGRLTNASLNQYLSTTASRVPLTKTNKLFRRFLEKHFFASFDKVDEAYNGVNRHKILHGRDLTYANKKTSLQAILTLDLLLSSFRFLSKEDSNLLHRYGCPELQAETGEITYYDTWFGRDKIVCDLCFPKIVEDFALTQGSYKDIEDHEPAETEGSDMEP